MVIHHGGAGTTVAGLRAGIPNIVVLFTADQPFWGRRVRAIGAVPKPILIKDPSVQKLTQALTETESASLHKNTQMIGHQIRNEEGVSMSVELIEKIF
jgi:sterol 3beta-glucosyltransferase